MANLMQRDDCLLGGMWIETQSIFILDQS